MADTPTLLVLPWKKKTYHASDEEPANGDEDQKALPGVEGKNVESIDGFDCE